MICMDYVMQQVHAKREDNYQNLLKEKDVLRRDQLVLTDIEKVTLRFSETQLLSFELRKVIFRSTEDFCKLPAEQTNSTLNNPKLLIHINSHLYNLFAKSICIYSLVYFWNSADIDSVTGVGRSLCERQFYLFCGSSVPRESSNRLWLSTSRVLKTQLQIWPHAYQI